MLDLCSQLKVLQEEYSSLRKECIATIGYRIQILTFTFTSLSIIVASLLTRNRHDLLTAIISLFVVPQIAKASLLMWLGEYHRSARAGKYLRVIEKKINDILGIETVGWETDLAQSKGHISYAYTSVVGIILGIGYVASALGIFSFSFSQEGTFIPRIFVALMIYFSLWEATSLAYFLFKWDGIRKI